MLYAGTSGFAYPNWKPDFYPKEVPQKKFLSHYAQRLNSVEINYTFRRLPAASTLEGWFDQTAAGFTFALKAHQKITHILRLKNTDSFTELFFKATAERAVGSGGEVRIREDSTWDVPEPELTLAITASGKIIGYTIGNDMSSRSIEGENPLYLPQAKTYDGCAAIGPCIYVTEEPLPPETAITLEIRRERQIVFEGRTELKQLKRTPQELVSFLYRECSFPHGSLLMTGTGVVPPSTVTLQRGDEIAIAINPIVQLVNKVK